VYGRLLCVLNVVVVTTPKVGPPPPRNAQKSSELRYVFAVTWVAFGSTTVNCKILSTPVGKLKRTNSGLKIKLDHLGHRREIRRCDRHPKPNLLLHRLNPED
jgi:hypothetical protein